MIKVLLFFALLPSLLHPVTLEVTPAQQALIVRALRVYADLHDGKFKLVTTGKTNGHVYRAIEVQGERFRFVDTVTAPAYPRHYLTVSAGMGLAAGYHYSLLSWLSIGATVDNGDGGRVRGSVGVRF